MTPAHLYTLFRCTPSKVLAFFEEPFFSNRAEAVVYGYLCRFIGNMSLEQVRVFHIFVSGRSVCTVQKVEVQFNGLACRPIAHTCSLEHPVTYTLYEREFQQVILSHGS